MLYIANQPTFIIVGGPAGTGKSTAGLRVANACHSTYIEGDDLHPAANIEKMSHGIPLTDDDRWGWLEIIAKKGSEAALSSTRTHIAVGTCSALTKKYRDFLKAKMDPKVRLIILFLHASEEELCARVLARKGHYMGVNMVKSQVQLMEIPEQDELVTSGGTCVNVLATKTPDEVYHYLMDHLVENKVLEVSDTGEANPTQA